MVRLGNVERDLGGQFLLEHREAVERARIAARDVDEEVVVVERLELDLDVGRLHDLVELAVLLARDELAVLVGELDLGADLVVESLFATAHQLPSPPRRATRTHLDELELEHEMDRRPDFSFEAMQLEAIALEHGFRARGRGDVAKNGRNLRRVDRRRGHEDVERDGEEPKTRDVELARLHSGHQFADRRAPGRKGRTNCMMARIVRSMLTRWSP